MCCVFDLLQYWLSNEKKIANQTASEFLNIRFTMGSLLSLTTVSCYVRLMKYKALNGVLFSVRCHLPRRSMFCGSL